MITNNDNYAEKLATSITYAYGKVLQVTEHDGDLIETLGAEWNVSRKGFENEMTLAHCGSFHRSSLFKELGDFDTEFRIAGDYEFLLRAYNRNHEFAKFIDTNVVVMRSGGISGSLKNRLRMARETNLARHKNVFKKISWPIVLWVARIRVYQLLVQVLGEKNTNSLADVYRASTGKKKRWS